MCQALLRRSVLAFAALAAIFGGKPAEAQSFDPNIAGSGNLSWTPNENTTLSAGVRFTQQLSSQSDLDWNGVNLLPQLLLNMRFN